MIVRMLETDDSCMKELQLMTVNGAAGITSLSALKERSPQLNFTARCLLSRGSQV